LPRILEFSSMISPGSSRSFASCTFWPAGVCGKSNAASANARRPTQELVPVVTSEAVGADAALLLFTAPIAPEPPVPFVFTPARLTTVIDETTL
jgi:hypothetical protein